MLKRPEIRLKKDFMHNCHFIISAFFAVLGPFNSS
jgi:hypothetical protein